MTQERSIPAAVQQELEAANAPHALLTFLMIEHEALTAPLRVVSDVLDYVKGGETYSGIPFDFAVLTDDDSGPKTQIKMQNVDRRIGQALRALNSRALMRVEVCSSADFDLTAIPRTEVGTAASVYAFAHFTLRDVTVTPIEITGTVMLRDFTQEPWPSARATQSRLPGSWR